MSTKAPNHCVKDLKDLAAFIQSDQCQSIAILTGAGVSCESGIPDFRSPGGLYQTLKPELLTATEKQRNKLKIDPMHVVSWELFQQTALPWLEVRRPFILGTQQQQWKATIAHRFFELLHTKTHKVTRLYTQNIDGLDQQCHQLPAEKIVNVHGIMSKAACEGCGKEADFAEFCDQVRSSIKNIYDPKDGPNESTPIECANCGRALVKPKTVLFGRQLPEAFFDCFEKDIEGVDLLIVAGTSLVVSPANSLVYCVPKSAVRVVMNQEPVGEELGINYNVGEGETERDFFAKGRTDQVCLELIAELGWLEDLKAKRSELPPGSLKLLEAFEEAKA